MRRVAPFIAAGALGFMLVHLPQTLRLPPAVLLVLVLGVALTVSLTHRGWDRVPVPLQALVPLGLYWLLLWPRQGDQRQQVLAWGALLLVTVVLAMPLVLPMDRLRRGFHAAPPLLAAVAFLLLMGGTAEAVPYMLFLALLPLLWLALYHGQEELLAGIAVTAAALVAVGVLAPNVVMVPEGLISVGLLAIVALVVYQLVERGRARAQVVEQVGLVMRRVPLDAEPERVRAAICAAAEDLLGGGPAAIFDQSRGPLLVQAAGSYLGVGEVTFDAVGSCEGLDGRVYGRAPGGFAPLEALSRGVAVVRGLEGYPPGLVAAALLHGMRGEFAQPVMVAGELAAVISVAVRTLDAGDASAEGMALLADEAGHALGHALEIARLSDEAGTDPLTRVANRRTWEARLPLYIDSAARSGEPMAVAILDLDYYKEYNDRWGHQMGDRLLQRVVSDWRSALRDVDFIARYGGDEFAALLPGCGPDGALAIIERLRAATPDEQRWSAGVAVWDGRETAADLVGRADLALYEVKKRGRGTVSVASSHRRSEVAPLPVTVEEVLAGAAVQPVFQPMRDLATGKAIGYEAFARLPGGQPDDSIRPVLEQARRQGRINDLDWLCRRQALLCSAQLDLSVPVFVNVDPAQLSGGAAQADQMVDLVLACGRVPQDVVLEFSETAPPRDLGRLSVVAAAYRERGFRLCIDDVGEGESTLQVLSAVMPEFMKISPALVRAGAARGPRSVLNAVGAFATSSGGTLIAERLESADDIAAARRMRLRFGQGYALGMPAGAGTRTRGRALNQE